MACDIVSIQQSSGTCVVDGGIVASYGTDCGNIQSWTVDADGQITAFVMTGVGQWSKFIFDDDDSGFYNQDPDRQGKKYNSTQQAFLKFEGIDNAKVNAARQAAECCCTVWIHELSTGTLLVQGIDVDINDLTANRFSKTNARVSPGVYSDTGDNAERVEYTIDSVGRTVSAVTTLTTAAIEAL